ILDLPFITAKSSDELVKKINSFNDEVYKYDLDKFSDSVGSFESGKACYMLSKRIEEICFS
ncbi:MAG: hypothetical protein ACRCXT_05490, partial [Paraclostridium sp.]